MSLCVPTFGQIPRLFPEPELPTLSASPVERLGDDLVETGIPEINAENLAESAAEPVFIESTPERSRGGRWRAAPHLDATSAYNDNIFIQREGKVADFIFTLAPGFAAGIWDDEERLSRFLDRGRHASFIEKNSGNFLLLDYTAIFLGFARTSSENDFNQDATLDFQWQQEKLAVGATLHFETKSEANTDVGARVRRQTFSGGVYGSYQLTGKTALDVVLYHIRNEPERFVRSTEWRNENYLTYAVTPLVRGGLGVAVGQVTAEGSQPQIFEQILARAIYSLSEKVDVEIRGGVEFRQTHAEPGDRTDPVMELRVGYAPAAGTRLELEGFRRIETSALAPEQNFTATGFVFKGRRATFGRLQFTVAAGLHYSDYTTSRAEAGGEDWYVFVRPGLLYRIASWGSAELSYQYRENDSTRAMGGFTNHEIEIRLSAIY